MPSLSFYAFEPGAPGVPSASATGVYIAALLGLLERHSDRIDLRLRWLRPAKRAPGDGWREARAAIAWLSRELTRMLADRSRYMLFFYPKIPVRAHVTQPAMLSLARRAYQALALKVRATGQRIVVIMEDLPIEMAEGKAAAGGSAVEFDVASYRSIERTVLRMADLIVTPTGYVDTMRELYGIEPERFRTFRRNIYLPVESPQAPEGMDFEKGEVNFLYAGAIDATLVDNFREILRSIRTAPQARLHVCGPGRESVESWLSELAVPNARHYGRLDVASHDWLAQRCDAGLILWPTDNPYFHLTPTSKYSSYVANGLAILSTDLGAIAENVRRDGVGRAMPIKELSVELLRWAAKPSLFAEFKGHARQEAEALRTGEEMLSWINEVSEWAV